MTRESRPLYEYGVQLKWLLLVVCGFILGIAASAPVHELGHVIATEIVAGKVEKVRWFYSSEGRPMVRTSGVFGREWFLVDSGGVLLCSAVGLIALFTIPWRKLRPSARAVMTGVLMYFVGQSSTVFQLVLGGVEGDVAHLIEKTGVSPWAVLGVGAVVFSANMWLLLGKTGFGGAWEFSDADSAEELAEELQKAAD